MGFRCHSNCENINMHYAIHRSNKVCHPVILHTNQEMSWKPFLKWPLDALCQKRRHPHTLGNIFVTLGAPVKRIQGVSSYKFPKVATITLPNEATVCRCASRNPCDPWSFVKSPEAQNFTPAGITHQLPWTSQGTGKRPTNGLAAV